MEKVKIKKYHTHGHGWQTLQIQVLFVCLFVFWGHDKHVISAHWFLTLFFAVVVLTFLRPRILSQGFLLAKQVSYHLKPTSSPVFSVYFVDGFSWVIDLCWSWTRILHIPVSQVVSVTSMRPADPLVVPHSLELWLGFLVLANAVSWEGLA